MMIGPIQVGRLTISVPLALAPMAGVTNWPFRLLCREQGCGITVTEFVNDRAILHDNQRTRDMMELFPGESPVGVQIFGHTPETMAAGAVRVAEDIEPDFIDINMGCPAPKITRGCGGSSLLKAPWQAGDIVAKVVRAVAPLPVTVKMRIGWDNSSVNAVEVAQRAEAAGACMITVHGRTREQHYSGRADWDVIDSVARSVSVPVLGNGDISTPEEAKDRLATTAVRGLAIGRGAMGNPWIFRRTRHFLETGDILPDAGPEERVQLALRHLDLLVECQGQYRAVREMRKHAAWYLKGLRGANETRHQINAAESVTGLRVILNDFLATNDAATYQMKL